jgi:hypothetical protein
MKYCLILLLSLVIGVGCTLSVNLVQVDGKAKDVVDETTTNTPTVTPTVTIPSEIL